MIFWGTSIIMQNLCLILIKSEIKIDNIISIYEKQTQNKLELVQKINNLKEGEQF